MEEFEKEIKRYLLQYPQTQRYVKKMMEFIIVSAYPLCNDQEIQQLHVLKKSYDQALIRLEKQTDKEKTVQQCIQLLQQAVNLYDYAFDRLADSYFDDVNN